MEQNATGKHMGGLCNPENARLGRDRSGHELLLPPGMPLIPNTVRGQLMTVKNMRVLSLTQPWATLMAIGAKRIETRSWPTSNRGPVLIHASKCCTLDDLHTATLKPFVDVLEDAGYCRNWRRRGDGLLYPNDLPLGCIVAFGTLTHVEMITRDNVPHEPELLFGDYTPGRYAWHFDDVRRLVTPVPAKGALGFWRWSGEIELEARDAE